MGLIVAVVRLAGAFRNSLAGWILPAGLAAVLLHPAGLRAQEDPLEWEDDVLVATDSFLRRILQGEEIELPLPDPAETDEYFRELQVQLEGEYVLDLAPFKRTADFLLPLLEAHDSLRDLGAWLRSRRDYFEVLEELLITVPPPSGTNAPVIIEGVLPEGSTNGVVKSARPLANPPLKPAPVVNPARPVVTNRVTVEVVPEEEEKPLSVEVVIVPPPRAVPRSNPPASTLTPPSPSKRTLVAGPVGRENPSPEAVRKAWTRQLSARGQPSGAALLVPRLKPLFAAAGVPVELVWLAEVESGFDARARSPAGAVGLYQLMPVTARSLGLRTFPFDERKSPEPSARAAARYLRQLYGQFGDWPLALAAYNAGPARVRNLLNSLPATSYGEIARRLPAETQLYVPKFDAVLQRREGRLLKDLAATTLPPVVPR